MNLCTKATKSFPSEEITNFSGSEMLCSKAAGFTVLTTEDENAALEQISQMDCGVLLICYSLPHSVRKRLAEAFRQHCPEGRIIAITNMKIQKPDFADTFVYGLEGPETLISTILQR